MTALEIISLDCQVDIDKITVKNGKAIFRVLDSDIEYSELDIEQIVENGITYNIIELKGVS